MLLETAGNELFYLCPEYRASPQTPRRGRAKVQEHRVLAPVKALGRSTQLWRSLPQQQTSTIRFGESALISFNELQLGFPPVSDTWTPNCLKSGNTVDV